MSSKIQSVGDQELKAKQKKSQRKLKTHISPKYNIRESLKKSVKKEKSQKKMISQQLSRRELELRSNYYDKQGQKGIKNSKEDYFHEKANEPKKKRHHQKANAHHTNQSRNASEETEKYRTLKGSNEFKNHDHHQDTNRLRIFESKGFITFDGKLIKMPPKLNNYPCTTSFANYTENQYIQDKKSKKKRKRERSYQKEPSKIIKSKSKSKSKSHKKNTKISNKKVLKKSIGIKFQNSTLAKKCKEDLLETEPTPFMNTFQSKKESINIDELKKDIQEEIKKQTRINLNSIDEIQRFRCLNMLSKICGLMQFRKETFALSLVIFDRYLDGQSVHFESMKLISLVSLILAVKHEEGNRSHEFIFQIIASSSLQYERQGRKSHSARNKKDDKKAKSKEKEKKKKEETIHKKTEIMSMILLERFGEMKKFKKSQLAEIENIIFAKLNFKIRAKTYVEWVDAFTVLWDQHIITHYNDGSHEKLLFRCPKSITNFHILLQILQASYSHVKVSEYNEIVLVLSVMYLLLRILMQGEVKQGFQTYRKSLKKSSNSLFIDRVGCNQIFGEYLENLALEMGEILLCCQYVSNYLYVQMLSEKKIMYDATLLLHYHNPALYWGFEPC